MLMSFVGLFIAAALSPNSGDITTRQFDTLGVVIGGGSLLFFLLAGFAYFLLRDGLPKGSIGKRMMGLRVFDTRTGRPCKYPASLLRNFIQVVLQEVDLLVPLFTKKRTARGRSGG